MMQGFRLGLSALLILCMANVQGQQVAALTLDSTAQVLVTDVLIDGNKLTQERIILRELTFAPGDSLFIANLRAGMEQSRNNIMNLRLFNFVEVEAIQVGHQQVMVLITVQERWYVYPVPILEIAQTNFNTWWETRELRWLNYGASITHSNFRGRNERLSLVARFGYTKRFSLSYSVPNLNRRQTLGLSLSAGYFENNEIVFDTENNRRLFYNNPDDKARSFFQYSAGLRYRENIYTSHQLQLAWFDARVNDTIPILRPDYFAGGGSRSQFLRASYTISHDKRDYQRYPLKGYLLTAHFQQDGLGFLSNARLNLFTTSATYRHHHRLGKRTYLAHSIQGKINWEDPPYFLLRGLGYGEFVRGYEFYVIDGTHFGLLQSQFKYALLHPKAITIPFVPSRKFSDTFIALYINAFFDAGYVSGGGFETRNSLVNQYLYSAGLGLDLVTYYDKVVRVEGSLNALGDVGIFVHFKQAF